MDKEYIKKILRYKRDMYLELKRANEILLALKHIICLHTPYDIKRDKAKHTGYAKFEWQYWIRFKNGKIIPEDIPVRHMKEMLAHMIVISKLSGEGLHQWYFNNKDKMMLSEPTKYWIERRIVKDLYW